MQTRDIVVVGASMGGIEALSALVSDLPADFPAAVFVVQHTSTESPGLLAEILSSQGQLPAVTAADGMQPDLGRIYVSPADRHLLLVPDGIRVVFGPRENRSRPSIDPLFRTAAVNYRSRVVGVVLTGLLGDGAAGLRAIEQCGGVPLVQEPGSAAHPEMPRNALAATKAAQQVRLPDMSSLLDRLVREPAPHAPPIPDSLLIEVQLTERAMKADDWHQVPGHSTSFTCPECNGAVHQVADDGPARFRCRVGHAYTATELVAAKDESLEQALWIALQTLQERGKMLETMASDDRRRGWDRSAVTLEGRARETHGHADRLRELIATISRPC